MLKQIIYVYISHIFTNRYKNCQQMGALEMTTEALQKQGKNAVCHILPSICWGQFAVSII
jgi:hypothetical protein